MEEDRDDWVDSPQALKRWRAALGLSQAGAAELLGVGLRTVTGWEIGEFPIPLTVTYACRWFSAGEEAK